MKILFAGSENSESAKMMEEMGAKNLLLSYYYLRKKKDPSKLLDPLRKSAQFLFLDSGAHTFFHEAGISVVHGKKETATQESPDQYLREYIDWLKQWEHYFDGYAELDIDQIVGHDKILEWHALWKESKLPNVVYVYHPSQPISYWEKICAENKYVGIQGNLPLARYIHYFKTAKQYKTKVHGFAMTKTEAMLKMPFFSVDSTSWQSGERFGITYEFNGRNLLMHLKDDKVKARRKLKPKVAKAGLDPEALIRDERGTVGRWNLLQWIEFEKYIDSHSKTYWDDSITANNVTTVEKPKGETKEPKGKTRDPAKYLPDSHRGKIMEIRQDPTIEERRRIAVAYANRGNMYNFKHGKYMSANAFMTCANCYVSDKCPAYQEPTEENKTPVCAFSEIFNDTFKADNFDVRNMDTVIESYNRVVTTLLQRLSRAAFFEQMDGGMVDKALVPLYGILVEFMKIQKKDTSPPPGQYTQNNYYVAAEQLKQLSPEKRKQVADAIRTALGDEPRGSAKDPVSA